MYLTHHNFNQSKFGEALLVLLFLKIVTEGQFTRQRKITHNLTLGNLFHDSKSFYQIYSLDTLHCMWDCRLLKLSYWMILLIYKKRYNHNSPIFTNNMYLVISPRVKTLDDILLIIRVCFFVLNKANKPNQTK